MKTENVLCIELEPLKKHFDLNKESCNCSREELNRIQYTFLPRNQVEHNTNYKQVIPYALIFNSEGKILSYQRCGTEKRLKGICSVGLGGHVNDLDKECSLSDTIENGLCRELQEEIGLNTTPDKLELLDFINEDRSEIGLCHIGLTYKIVVNTEELSFDKEVGTPEWLNCEELKLTNYELWSTLALKLTGKIKLNSNRTIVSIMSAQLSPNYLFIKEMYKKGDELIIITSKTMEKKLNLLLPMLPQEAKIKKIVLNEDGDEEKWNVMVDNISKHLSKDDDYMVNLTGGTKYMSMAVMNVFEKYNSRFYYIPSPKNVIVEPMSNDIRELSYRMGVEEYLKLNGREIKSNKVTQTEEYSDDFFHLFTTKGMLSNRDFEILDNLRAYRDKNIVIKDIENGINESSKYPAIKGLRDFLSYINFPLENPNKLSKYECRYITGGWFEEYIYFLIKQYIKPNDILLGVETQRNQDTNINDLDVVFMLGNKMYITECKTGVGKESMLKGIVYKASALKSHIGGLATNSYILSLSPHKEDWANISRNLGATYWGREYFTNEENWELECNKIIKSSYDR